MYKVPVGAGRFVVDLHLLVTEATRRHIYVPIVGHPRHGKIAGVLLRTTGLKRYFKTNVHVVLLHFINFHKKKRISPITIFKHVENESYWLVKWKVISQYQHPLPWLHPIWNTPWYSIPNPHIADIEK